MAAAPSPRSLRALDALTFFAPDIQGGVGPFLVVFMASTLAWDARRIGTVMATSAVVGLLVQAPAGALIDRVRHKPRWIGGAIAVIATSLMVMAFDPRYAVILVGQSVVGVAGTLVAPAIAAVSIGIVGRAGMERRIGRNAAIGAAGTVLWALGTGVVGHAFGAHAMFVFAVLMAVPTVLSALAIREADIDQRVACGADAEPPAADDAQPHRAAEANSRGYDRLYDSWYDRRFAVLMVCAFLFHLSNAAMLTLVAQRISSQVGHAAPLWLSAGVIVTQLVTVPIGLALGRWAPGLARKPLFLVAFAVLPVRALLYLVAPTPGPMIALQVLDGVGAGIFGVMLTLMVSDLTRGSGRFNLALGISAVAVGLGAAASNLVAGFVAHAGGYGSSFVTLAVAAGAALLLFAFGMPETRHGTRPSARPPAAASTPEVAAS